MWDKQFKTLKAMRKHLHKKKQTETRLTRHGSERMVNTMMPSLQLMKQQSWFNISHWEQHSQNWDLNSKPFKRDWLRMRVTELSSNQSLQLWLNLPQRWIRRQSKEFCNYSHNLDNNWLKPDQFWKTPKTDKLKDGSNSQHIWATNTTD